MGSRAFKACITPLKGALGGACRTEVSGMRGLRRKAKAAVGPSWARWGNRRFPAHAQGLKGLGSEYCKHKVQAGAESFGSTRSRLGCEFCKSDCENGARLGLVSRREGLLGGSRAREGVRGLPRYALTIALGHLDTQVRGRGRGQTRAGVKTREAFRHASTRAR